MNNDYPLRFFILKYMKGLKIYVSYPFADSKSLSITTE